MTAPPWGHKPPAVANVQAFWVEPPDSLSPRVEYWLRRLHDGTGKPNRRFRVEGYHSRAQYLGVYLWEYWHVIVPALAGRDTPQPRPLVDCSVFNDLR